MRVPIRGQPQDWLEWIAGSDRRKWKEATLILGGLEPDDPIPVEPLIAALDDHREDVVFWSIIGLQRLGGRSAAACGKMGELALRHPAFGIRQAAVGALPRIDPQAKATKTVLFLALEDEDPFVRMDALQALIHVPVLDASDLSRIKELEGDENEHVAFWADVAFRNIQLRQPAGDGVPHDD